MRPYYITVFSIIISFLFLGSACKKNNTHLSDFPDEANPELIGRKLTERFINQPHSQYGSPLRSHEPRTQITYPDVCVWLGGLRFARAINDKELIKKLENRFQPLFDQESHLQPKPNHVDNNVFGALALELYTITNEKKYKTLGMWYADTQWILPNSASEKEKEWHDKGYSWQTRLWLDDMFMITTIQSQAFRVTENQKYIDRAAREMALYLDSIQLNSGLFNHSPSAPFRWGRGNGWMAVGLVELLRALPSDNPHRKQIFRGYKKMMKELLTHQADNGMWRQLVDDKEIWEETSGSAMFTYAFIVGVKNNWLDEDQYGKAARKAWIALTNHITENGDVTMVCEGTNIGKSRAHYKNRKALTGDLHGQAPVLWCAYALVN